jgi:hypothetical protein
MTYQRGPDLTEWYLNTPLGLEQGFTLSAPPAHSPPGEQLILEMALSGTLTPRLQGSTLLLCDATGQGILRYTGLYAVDSTGKSLPARLALQGDTLRIIVYDTAATYPITIDPWVQKSKLWASDGEAGDFFGYSVAISGDTVVVGAYDDDIGTNNNQGSAYVFEKPGSGWATTSNYTARLTANDGATGDHFGGSVAISGDTVVVGAYGDDSFKGSAYVFKLTGGLAPIYMLLLGDGS